MSDPPEYDPEEPQPEDPSEAEAEYLRQLFEDSAYEFWRYGF